MSDKCPSCGSDFDFRASRAMPGWEGGWPYNQFKCYSVLDDNGFHQSDRCRIRQLEAEVKRLKSGKRDRLVLCGEVACEVFGLGDENNSPNDVRNAFNEMAYHTREAIAKQAQFEKLSVAYAKLERLLRGWLTAFQKYGPSGSHQFEKFDAIKRETEMVLEPATTEVITDDTAEK